MHLRRLVRHDIGDPLGHDLHLAMQPLHTLSHRLRPLAPVDHRQHGRVHRHRLRIAHEYRRHVLLGGLRGAGISLEVGVGVGVVTAVALLRLIRGHDFVEQSITKRFDTIDWRFRRD